MLDQKNSSLVEKFCYFSMVFAVMQTYEKAYEEPTFKLWFVTAKIQTRRLKEYLKKQKFYFCYFALKNSKYFFLDLH